MVNLKSILLKFIWNYFLKLFSSSSKPLFKCNNIELESCLEDNKLHNLRLILKVDNVSLVYLPDKFELQNIYI